MGPLVTNLRSRHLLYQRHLLMIWIAVSSLWICGCEGTPTQAHSDQSLSSTYRLSAPSVPSYSPRLSLRTASDQKKREELAEHQPQTSVSQSTSPSKEYSIKVERLIVARGVKKRRAIGEARIFPTSVGSVWSYAVVTATGASAQLQMRWWKRDQLVNTSPFIVSEGLRWGEWCQMNITPKDSGDWRIEIYDPHQQIVLGSSLFQISPSEQSSSAAAVESKLTSKRAPYGSGASLEVSPSQSLIVSKLVIARNIKRRRPLGLGTQFRLRDERLWGFIEVSNLQKPSQVWMEWHRDGELRSRLLVKVGMSERWRTWSWQRLSKRDTGRWEVTVLDEENTVLARRNFTVSP